MKKKESNTLNYYNQNAADFIANTENADVSTLRNRFLKLVPAGGRILDWGCGSGRDIAAFMESGYQADAVDASEELCKRASEKTGIKVKCESFEELYATEKYDGIWACASLLHLEKSHLAEVITRAENALKPDGVMYISFKYGDFEGERKGRFFTDMTEAEFDKIISHIENMEIIDQWITEDVRKDREDEKWLNLILRKLHIN
jgi:SAM-dependent methyltransferase